MLYVDVMSSLCLCLDCYVLVYVCAFVSDVCICVVCGFVFRCVSVCVYV